MDRNSNMVAEDYDNKINGIFSFFCARFKDYFFLTINFLFSFNCFLLSTLAAIPIIFQILFL